MKKPHSKLLTTLMWFFLYVLVVWFAVLLASSYQKGLSIIELLPVITEAVKKPFEIRINEYTLQFVAMFSLLFAIGVAAYYAYYGKRRLGEEHGSASWGESQRD